MVVVEYAIALRCVHNHEEVVALLRVKNRRVKDVARVELQRKLNAVLRRCVLIEGGWS